MATDTSGFDSQQLDEIHAWFEEHSSVPPPTEMVPEPPAVITVEQTIKFLELKKYHRRNYDYPNYSDLMKAVEKIGAGQSRRLEEGQFLTLLETWIVRPTLQHELQLAFKSAPPGYGPSLVFFREAISQSVARTRKRLTSGGPQKIHFVRPGDTKLSKSKPNPDSILGAATDWTIMMDTREKHYMMPPEIFVTSLRPDIVFDTEERNFLELEELEQLVTSFGDKFTPDEVCELLRDANMRGDGNVDYRQFVRSMFRIAPELNEIPVEYIYTDGDEDPSVPPLPPPPTPPPEPTTPPTPSTLPPKAAKGKKKK